LKLWSVLRRSFSVLTMYLSYFLTKYFEFETSCRIRLWDVKLVFLRFKSKFICVRHDMWDTSEEKHMCDQKTLTQRKNKYNVCLYLQKHKQRWHKFFWQINHLYAIMMFSCFTNSIFISCCKEFWLENEIYTFLVLLSRLKSLQCPWHYVYE